jgi:sugar/nucleoside kinase (ribokinase family)
VLDLGVEGFTITRASQGATLFYRDSDHFHTFDIEAIHPERAVDPTGCGDVFAAAFCYRYATTRSVLDAAEFANRVAAIKSTFSGLGLIDTISEQLKAKASL